MLNMAVLAPIPSASVISATAVNPGLRRRPRRAKRKSISKVAIPLAPGKPAVKHPSFHSPSAPQPTEMPWRYAAQLGGSDSAFVRFWDRVVRKQKGPSASVIVGEASLARLASLVFPVPSPLRLEKSLAHRERRAGASRPES